MNKIILFISAIAIISSCKQAKTSKTLIIENVSLNLEGPLFEGSNTGQSIIEFPLKSFLSENNLKNEDLKEAELTELTIVCNDSTNFNNVQSFTFQFVTDNTAMVKVAFINPIPENANSIQLKIADEQKAIIDLLKQDKFFIVADAIIKTDSETNLELKCNLKFNIKH
jgi:hypothetical protein